MKKTTNTHHTYRQHHTHNTHVVCCAEANFKYPQLKHLSLCVYALESGSSEIGLEKKSCEEYIFFCASTELPLRTRSRLHGSEEATEQQRQAAALGWMLGRCGRKERRTWRRNAPPASERGSATKP